MPHPRSFTVWMLRRGAPTQELITTVLAEDEWEALAEAERQHPCWESAYAHDDAVLSQEMEYMEYDS